LQALFDRDWAHIEAGDYLAPDDGWPNPFAVLRQSRRYFRDLRDVNRRIAEGGRREVAGRGDTKGFPDYYLQNFHFQSDGYLSGESAALYDYQVEVLFTGGADAMRRQALVPLGETIRKAGVRTARLLDIACGTGRFLGQLKDNFPRLRVAGVDLSPHYLAKARENLAPWSRTALLNAAAEALPFADGEFDAVSCIYLFHELPRAVRLAAAAEIRRVLKPGGRFVFVDSLQPGDHPPFDPLLERFPQATHEPYYADYLNQDLADLFAEAGFETVAIDRAFFSRIMVLAPAS
jgi:ubiquinone/menaquinone biosynthesis C-methylase UbiE